MAEIATWWSRSVLPGAGPVHMLRPASFLSRTVGTNVQPQEIPHPIGNEHFPAGGASISPTSSHIVHNLILGSRLSPDMHILPWQNASVHIGARLYNHVYMFGKSPRSLISRWDIARRSPGLPPGDRMRIVGFQTPYSCESDYQRHDTRCRDQLRFRRSGGGGRDSRHRQR